MKRQKPKILRDDDEGLIGSSIVLTKAQHAKICELVGHTTVDGYQFRSFSQVIRFMVEQGLRKLQCQHGG